MSLVTSCCEDNSGCKDIIFVVVNNVVVFFSDDVTDLPFCDVDGYLNKI